jgi:UDP-N-acetyl-D-mannosaminuronic acid transferase (WecB/TagA/CpsF family)
METNRYWLEEQGFRVKKENNYVAPLYPKESISDRTLMQQLVERDPKVVVLCIGGGVQERLGLWLREEYKVLNKPCPAIVCTGAAIGFLSGNQVNIPRWADRLYLGWLLRCLYEPKKFIPRYWNALPLASLVYRYGETLPPMASEKKG